MINLVKLPGCLVLLMILDCYCKHPIVIVPGIGGSQIEARLDRKIAPHWWCEKSYGDWFTIWLDIEELFPVAQQCWCDNLKFVYNASTGKMENTPGVETRTPGFGNTSAIEWLDPSSHYAGIYFYPFVDSLVKLLGYQRGTDLRAAPYDFRKDPSSAGDYFDRLRILVEETYESNRKKPVMMVSHSMGVPYTMYFFRQQSQEWKDKYVKAWTTISGAYAGSVKAVMAYISGDGFGIPSILDKPSVLREFQRTFSSLAFILPDSRVWNDSEPLVKTSTRTYSVNQYDELFRDLNFTLGSAIFHSIPKAWDPEPPNIKTFCFYGRNVDTPGLLTYPEGYFPDYDPVISFVSGDGTVTERSLEMCKHWAGKQEQSVFHETFEGAEHNGILGDARLLRSFFKALKSLDNADNKN